MQLMLVLKFGMLPALGGRRCGKFLMPPLSSTSGTRVLVQQRCTHDHRCGGSHAGTHTCFIKGACAPDSGSAASYRLMHKEESMDVMMTEACAALSSLGTHQFPTPTACLDAGD
jgi:hypothetical protein